MAEIKGMISAVKRMEIHDGDGLRTTVFFKGCPLKCLWCHNPESIGYRRQIAFYSEKCIGCGECFKVCSVKARRSIGDIDRDRCTVCGECAGVCPTEALTVYGKEYSASELVSELMADAPFFKNGRGGVTLSGGECLSQGEFAAEVARLLYERGISVYVDTCGYVKREILDGIIPYTDKFLYDIKAVSPELHKRATGRDNAVILDNLKYLCDRGCDVEVRIPFVPEINGGEIGAMGAYLSELPITAVKVLPYHRYAGSRYAALGMVNTLPDGIPAEEELERAAEILSGHGIKVLRG